MFHDKSNELEQQIEALENEIAEKRKQINALKREWGARPVDDVVLDGWDGPVRLSELFGGKSDLVLVHNMGRECVMCTMWADGFNGVAMHLAARTAFAVCSPNSVDEQKAFAAGRGWTFRMVSDPTGDFTESLGYLVPHEGKKWAVPGVSLLHRDPDGSIRRTARDFFGPGDLYSSPWHLWDLIATPGPEWFPRFDYAQG
jgi:predicted dithiol-disulfide oxidoreductase (DUF899 family)